MTYKERAEDALRDGHPQRAQLYATLAVAEAIDWASDEPTHRHEVAAAWEDAARERHRAEVAEARLAAVRDLCQRHDTGDMGSLIDARRVLALLDEAATS